MTHSIPIGLLCFLAGAVIFALHPNHSWYEITGEPEAFPVAEQKRDVSIRRD